MKYVKFINKVSVEREIEKLDDKSVGDIAGGLSYRAQNALTVASSTAVLGTVVGVIPSAVCSGWYLYKAKKAQEKGRIYEAKQMWGNYCATVCVEGIAVLGTAVSSIGLGLIGY